MLIWSLVGPQPSSYPKKADGSSDNKSRAPAKCERRQRNKRRSDDGPNGRTSVKDKSFWFLAHEKFSLASYSYLLVPVPTTAMRQGDFSGLSNSSGVLQQLYDPSTTVSSSNCNSSGVANVACRTPFANNQIPLARLAPAAKVLLDITPAPSLNANPLIQSNLQA